LKGAVDTLRDINWLYGDVDSPRQIEWLLKLSVLLTVPWKFSEEDVAGLQAHTIHKIDQ